MVFADVERTRKRLCAYVIGAITLSCQKRNCCGAIVYKEGKLVLRYNRNIQTKHSNSNLSYLSKLLHYFKKIVVKVLHK